jgi:type II secretory pathway component PulF
MTMIGLVQSGIGVRHVLLLGMMAAILLVIASLGILPPRQTKAVSAVVAEVLAHAFAWAVILFGMFFSLPKVNMLLTDFGTELPAITRWAFLLNDFVLQAWDKRPILVFNVLLGILVIDGVVLFTLWERNAKAAARTAWSISMTAIPLAIIAFGEAALFFPLAKLFHELS